MMSSSSPSFTLSSASAAAKSQSESQSSASAAFLTDSLSQLPGAVVLPEVPSDSFVSQRHEVNPAMALSLLQDIQTIVVNWRSELRQVVQRIRSLHAQGPMVDGWLEAEGHQHGLSAAEHESTLLKHGDADALMAYVESLGDQSGASAGFPSPESFQSASADGPQANAQTSYRLCCLNAQGQIESHTCPPSQMGAVSLAISRYQKYRQLMDRKGVLEANLQSAVGQLGALREGLQQDDVQ